MVADRAGHLGRIPCALLTTDGLHSNRSLVVVIDKQRDAFGSITWATAAVQSFVVLHFIIVCMWVFYRFVFLSN